MIKNKITDQQTSLSNLPAIKQMPASTSKIPVMIVSASRKGINGGIIKDMPFKYMKCPIAVKRSMIPIAIKPIRASPNRFLLAGIRNNTRNDTIKTINTAMSGLKYEMT